MTALLRPRGRFERGPRKPLTQMQLAIMFALSLVGAFVGTIVFLIVITIIIGAAGGH